MEQTLALILGLLSMPNPIFGLWLNIPPYPTPEINRFIDLLGHDEWQKRETASKKLAEIGWPAIRAITWNKTHNKDLEIRHRCNRLEEKFYGIDMEVGLPSIWYMPNKDRFTVTDVAKQYYHRARKIENVWRIKYNFPIVEDWRDDSVARAATKLMVRELLWWGYTHKEVKDLVMKMTDNSGKMRNEWYRQECPPGKLVPNHNNMINKAPVFAPRAALSPQQILLGKIRGVVGFFGLPVPPPIAPMPFPAQRPATPAVGVIRTVNDMFRKILYPPPGKPEQYMPLP